MVQNKYNFLLTILLISSNQSIYSFEQTVDTTDQEQNSQINNPNKINQNKLKILSQDNLAQQTNQNSLTTQNSSWWKPTLQRTSSNASTSSLSSMSSDNSVDLSSLNKQSSAPASRSNSWMSNFSFRSSKNTATPQQAAPADQPIEVTPASKPAQEQIPPLDPKLIKNVRTNMITRANPQVQLTPEQTRVLQDPTTSIKYNTQDKTMSYKLANNQIDVNQNDQIVKTITTQSNPNGSSSIIEKNYTTGDLTTTNKDTAGNITSTEITRTVALNGLPSWTETTTLNPDGKTIQKKVVQTDGSYQIMTYDPSTQNGNSRSLLPQTETSYDAQGAKISLRNNKPNGSYSITAYDPKDPNKVIGKKSYNTNGTQTIGSQMKNLGN